MSRRPRRWAARLKDEKLHGEDVSQRLQVEETEEDKTLLKPPPLSLSDSENEEPLISRLFHKSAFVSKSSTNTLLALSRSINSKTGRSQSCNDPLNERCTRGRRRAAQLPRVKVSPGTCVSAGIVGVLSSTENSRSFSAPVLTSEKRLSVNCLALFTPLTKLERSSSPDSNDSISEELNHFKPIVCSPCTPPKILPDGQVLSPVLIKSTPRNLRRSLQQPTTYEASPLLLKKWELVFQDRQMKKTVSIGTWTSEYNGDPTALNEPVPYSNERSGCDTRVIGDVTVVDELLPSSSKAGRLKDNSGKSRAVPANRYVSSPGRYSGGSGRKDLRDVNLNENAQAIVTVQLASNVKTVSKDKCTGATEVKAPLKRPHKNNSQTANMQNGFPPSESISPAFRKRRGQKRLCKTKHLEQNGSVKRLKVAGGASCAQGLELLWREAEKRLHQEEEDQKLALKMQQIFDKETRMVNRCKGSRDEYPLRSKSTAGAN
ncbi:E3 ubiquitin-protein ligase RNF169 [Pelodytes ibericus]